MGQAIRPPSGLQLVTKDGERLDVPDEIPTAELHHTGGGGGDGSGGDHLQQRVEALEKGMQKLEGKIDKLTELVHGFGLKTSERLGTIEGRLTGIEKTLESKAVKSDLTPLEAKIAAVDGKISHLPTTSAMITLMLGAVGLSLGGAAGLAFTLFRIFKP